MTLCSNARRIHLICFFNIKRHKKPFPQSQLPRYQTCLFKGSAQHFSPHLIITTITTAITVMATVTTHCVLRHSIQCFTPSGFSLRTSWRGARNTPLTKGMICHDSCLSSSFLRKKRCASSCHISSSGASSIRIRLVSSA